MCVWGGGGGGGLKPVLCWKKKKLALDSEMVNKHTLFGPREGLLIPQNSKHINQDPTTLSWNKMSTQQQDPYWNAGATDIQQLKPNGPDQKQSIEPNQLYWTFYAGAFITSEARPAGVQLKRKVVNRDWVNHA